MTAPETYTFRGRTFAETIQKVTEKLGKDAYIIAKRELKGREGLLTGFLGGDEMVEIIASPTEPPKAAAAPPRRNLLQKTYCRPAESEGGAGESPAPAPGAGRARPVAAGEVAGRGLADRLDAIDAHLLRDANLLDGLRREMQGLFALQARGGMPAVSEELLHTYRQLVENDVAADIARGLVERLQREMPEASGNPEQVRLGLREAIARMIETAGPVCLKGEQPTVVALVGPTGAGKTTTLLKLAFEFVVKRDKRVGVITEDVRRPGAVEQLRSLDHFLGLPVICAETPARAAEEIEHLQGMDLILVDTAGRAPRNQRLLRELAGYLRAVRPDETHLVLPSNGSRASTLDTVERFASLPFDRVVFSKLDEAVSYGLILNVASRVAARVSYVTTGQEYMETVQPGDRDALARLIVGLDGVAAEPAAAGVGRAAEGAEV